MFSLLGLKSMRVVEFLLIKLIEINTIDLQVIKWENLEIKIYNNYQQSTDLQTSGTSLFQIISKLSIITPASIFFSFMVNSVPNKMLPCSVKGRT